MKNLNYQTRDFYIACILRTCKIPLTEIVREGYNYAIFIFDAPQEDCEEIIKKHWDRNLMVESRLLIETINELKTRIHERMKSNNL
jgi:hypothetical protein